jgi:hypothetical protein
MACRTSITVTYVTKVQVLKDFYINAELMFLQVLRSAKEGERGKDNDLPRSNINYQLSTLNYPLVVTNLMPNSDSKTDFL